MGWNKVVVDDVAKITRVAQQTIFFQIYTQEQRETALPQIISHQIGFCTFLSFLHYKNAPFLPKAIFSHKKVT